MRHQMIAAGSMGVLLVTVLVLGLAGLGPQQVVFALALMSMVWSYPGFLGSALSTGGACSGRLILLP